MNFNHKNKKISVIGVCLAILIITTCILSLASCSKEETKNPEGESIVVTEETIKQELYKSINQGFKIGDKKDSIIKALKVGEENIGKNYVINPNYTRIGKYDFLTAFIFNEDVLVAILHERVLDGTQRHNLAVEFQKFVSEIGELYTLVETKEEWFSTELAYDANMWNNAITNNDLELYANFENEETKEYVSIIASGINYFDFLANDREMLSVGNLNLIYTLNVYKDDFLGFVSLAANK